MSVLLETSLGDVVVDLDVEGSPLLVRNFLRLCQARYYSQTLIYSVIPGRCAYGGDPTGDGTGGACADALQRLYEQQQQQEEPAANDNQPPPNEQALLTSPARFLASQGRRLTSVECREKGRLVAVELQGIANTVGSQFLLTVAEGPGQALDGYTTPESKVTVGDDSVIRSTGWLSLGKVVEDDDNVLDQLNRTYVDNTTGRPYADIRIRRALIVYNPFEEILWPASFLTKRGILMDDANDRVVNSPSPIRPAGETVQPRIPMEQVLDDLRDGDEMDEQAMRKRLREEAEADRRQQDSSRARVLEMLGDLPDAQVTAPKNVLFVAKLNPITTDEDLQLIFSRFDPNVKVDIIRDHDTGQSLQYAFCAFSTEKQAAEAYFKMNQALVDDRRILVDFSQSVSHVWDKYRQQYRNMPAAHSFAPNNGQRSRDRGQRDARSGRGGHYPSRDSRKEGHWSNNNDERTRDRRDSNNYNNNGDGHRRDEPRRRPEGNYRDEGSLSKPRPHGYDSDEERSRQSRKHNRYGSEERRKRRHDDSDQDRKRKRKERRYDSDASDEDRKRRRKEKRSQRERYDSNSDDSRKKKKRHKRHRSDRDDEQRRRKSDRRERSEDDDHSKRDRKHGDRDAEHSRRDPGQERDEKYDSRRNRRPRGRGEEEERSNRDKDNHGSRHRDRHGEDDRSRSRDHHHKNGDRGSNGDRDRDRRHHRDGNERDDRSKERGGHGESRYIENHGEDTESGVREGHHKSRDRHSKGMDRSFDGRGGQRRRHQDSGYDDHR